MDVNVFTISVLVFRTFCFPQIHISLKQYCMRLEPIIYIKMIKIYKINVVLVFISHLETNLCPIVSYSDIIFIETAKICKCQNPGSDLSSKSGIVGGTYIVFYEPWGKYELLYKKKKKCELLFFNNNFKSGNILR